MLEGKNVSLRTVELEDLDYLNKWKNTEEVFKYLGGGFYPVSKDTQSQWMNSIIDTTNGNIRYIIQNKQNQPIGFIGLYSIHDIYRTAEIGLYIGEINEQKKGHAYEAYQLFENYIMNYLNIRKLKAYVVEINSPAVSFWHKNNYMVVGKFSKERYIDGEFVDVLIMEKFIQSKGD
ncbi:MAG: GNAT family protein [Anaerococcus sp.]|uniref:GNAT family N-acetyltransferase n=1 Tax=Anaerococcus sp. TaxID=1872515 RepID=UPI002590F0F2|nr:GNAT family protein [Anaerococcus sp.]MDU2353340.1 GNAT family protein [Anaerococcus sp.]MDU3212200.1 GNAT family protein [Anaerococcus sp.]